MRLFNKRFLKKVLTVALCMALTFVSFGIIIPESSYDVSALTSYEIQQKINDCESKQKEIQKKIDSVKDKQSDAKEKAEDLQEQVSVIEDKVSLMTQKVNALESEINKKNADIKERENSIKDAKELLKKRLRAICIAGASTDILVLLSADDYGDFLEKTDVMKCITTDTKDLMTKLEGEIKTINKEKKQVEAKKAEADSVKQQLVTEQKNLDAKYAEAQAAYSDLKDTENELEAESAEVEAEKDKLQKEFDRLARERAQAALQGNANNVPSVKVDGGSYGFAWPYGGSYYISSGFGYRVHPTLGYSKLHGGIDITGSGAYGKPIYAIADGQVILASYNGSYGNCIMIDHGTYNGTSIISLYAHASSINVGNGATVKKGQQIGNVGSTGRSTGPHLHFEIRANGERVNPLNYYSSY